MRSILAGAVLGIAVVTGGVTNVLADDNPPTTTALPAGQSSVSTTTMTGLQQGNPSQQGPTTTGLQKQNKQPTTTGMQYKGSEEPPRR